MSHYTHFETNSFRKSTLCIAGDGRFLWIFCLTKSRKIDLINVDPPCGGGGLLIVLANPIRLHHIAIFEKDAHVLDTQRQPLMFSISQQ